MALPTIISVAEDALDAGPKASVMRVWPWGRRNGRRSGEWWCRQPVRITTAVMLGMGRAIGETMAVMMVTGNAARMRSAWIAVQARSYHDGPPSRGNGGVAQGAPLPCPVRHCHHPLYPHVLSPGGRIHHLQEQRRGGLR